MPDDPEKDGVDAAADENDEGNGDERRIRSFWSGIITFGLVSVPVNLFAAYRSGRPSLRMVDEDGTPLDRRYYCPAHEKELSRDEIVRGYEVEEGRFVVVRDEELEALEPEKSREIDLRRFVPRSELDPIFFQRAYYLTPSTEATKPYRLLARVMEDAGRAGIATFVMRGREYLVAILADNGILRAETLRFQDELRSARDVGLPDPQEPEKSEVDALRDAVDARAEKELDLARLRDTWSEKLRDLARAKMEEGEDVVERPEEEEGAGEGDGEVIDIMQVLKRNLRGERSSDGASADELRKKTKDELYDRAQALDIRGRSKMTKSELVEAIREIS